MRKVAFALCILIILEHVLMGLYMMGIVLMAYEKLAYFGPTPIQEILRLLILQSYEIDEPETLEMRRRFRNSMFLLMNDTH